ncbi:hypothetical protein vseg_008788 [Gypsophila vaccaria]
MDSNNWRPNQGEAQPPPSADGGDWRSQLQNDSRQKIVNKIMETLKKHLPVSGQEGVQELKQIAIRFEEKIYSAATSQSDYLRKISLKMLTMESKSQNALPNAMPSNSGGRNPQDPASSQNLQSQVHNQNQSVPLQMAPNQSQARQQLLTHNIPKNMVSGTLQSGVSMPNTLPSNGLAQNPMPNVAQNSNLQNTSSISQNSMGNTMNQGIASSMFSNAQRQMQGRQQHIGSQQQQQQPQNSQQFIYQQQMQLKRQLLQQNLQQPLLQTQQQQQQQQQQPMMQTSCVMQQSVINGLQNQQSSIQQPTQSVLQQHQQSMIRQQPQQTPAIQQQQVLGSQLNAGNMQQNQLIGQQPNFGSMQQSQLIGQQANAGNTQQNQLIGQQPNAGNKQQSQLIGQQPTLGNMQQSNISDMQQQQQQQRLLGQQNNIQNVAPQQPTSHQNLQQQQHLMGQQSNLQNMPQQQLGHQSHVGGQQLMGTQSGNASMQTNQQQSVQMMQPTKVPVQQQTQNTLSGGVVQQQLQSQSPHLMSQLQSQPTQVQQQLPMNPQSNSLLQNMQQRMQNMNPLLQQQNLTDQQKLFQSQRATPEAPTSSLDSTAQTGSVNVGDWQEEVYQKIKSMKDLYYADLNEMYQKISFKLQQHDSLPQQPKIDQIEKLRVFKHMLERLMHVLQISKNNISPSHKEKLPSFEKQILNLLNPNKPRKPPQLQSYQQQHPQNPQSQSHDGGTNSQLQSMNIPGSGATMQQSSLTNLKHGSVPTLSAVTSLQQSIPSSLQPSNLDSGQTSGPSSMQQAAMSSLQMNTVSAPPQSNIGAIQSQTGVSLLHQNVNNIHNGPNMLQNQHLKQQHEQQNLKQHIHNRQIQMQKQQILQQQLNQQGQQTPQMQVHQMAQLQQLNDVNEKMRQLKSGAFAQHPSSSQRFMNHQGTPGASFPVSSPQLLNAVSPQIINHSSPQIDPQSLLPSVSKGGTPMHSANSPFVPSPSSLLVPSPMPGDHEKPAISSLTNAANVGQQTNSAVGAPQSLSIGTPGISPSPLFECTGPDGTLGNASATISGKSSATEKPIERLLRAVKSISPKALSSAISDISSVVSMVDRIAGSVPGNGSRATVGEDLVAMTKCRLQARNSLTQDGNNGAKRMKRYTSAMPLHVGASAGSRNDSLRQLNGPFTPELESTASSGVKKARIEVNHALLEEIREINERLIDTVVYISDEDMSPLVAAPAAEGSEGTVVKCSYNAITLSSSFRSQYTSAGMSPIQPLRLLVPDTYPNCSPILLDKLPIGVSDEHEDLSLKAKSRFSVSLRSVSQPMSLKDIARTWDESARAVVSEYAQRFGGGTFSSKYGTWENCLSAA